MSHAIVPGSFDPMTLGHLSLIKRVAAEYDRVTVAVMINPDKEYLFNTEARVAIAKATVEELSNVDVIYDDGMLIDLYDKLGADAVCKGWRNPADLLYEKEMAEWNLEHNPRFVTNLLHADAEYATLSSTEVREMIARGESLASVVHANALPLIASALDSEGAVR